MVVAVAALRLLLSCMRLATYGCMHRQTQSSCLMPQWPLMYLFIHLSELCHVLQSVQSMPQMP